jgi:hypothetical protein
MAGSVHSEGNVIQQQPSGAMRERIRYLAECDPVLLAERRELGVVNFQLGRGLFRRAVELGREIQGLSLELLPDGTRRQLFEALDDLALTLQRIACFTPAGKPDPEDERDTLLHDAHIHYDRAFTLIAPYLGYLYLKNAQLQDSTRNSTEQLQESLGQVSESLQEIRQRLTELDRTLQATRRTTEAPGATGPTGVRLPVIYGFTSNEITNQWTCFFFLAPFVIGFLIWIGLQIYHWGM